MVSGWKSFPGSTFSSGPLVLEMGDSFDGRTAKLLPLILSCSSEYVCRNVGLTLFRCVVGTYLEKVLLEMGERVEGGGGKHFWKIMAGVGKIRF